MLQCISPLFAVANSLIKRVHPALIVLQIPTRVLENTIANVLFGDANLFKAVRYIMSCTMSLALPPVPCYCVLNTELAVHRRSTQSQLQPAYLHLNVTQS